MAEMQRLVDKYPNGYEGLEEVSSADGVVDTRSNSRTSHPKLSNRAQDDVVTKA